MCVLLTFISDLNKWILLIDKNFGFGISDYFTSHKI